MILCDSYVAPIVRSNCRSSIVTYWDVYRYCNYRSNITYSYVAPYTLITKVIFCTPMGPPTAVVNWHYVIPSDSPWASATQHYQTS